MFKHYFIIALRNVLRNKIYSLINILGLALGMACCILIMLWIQDELNYDSFNVNKENIYRVNKIWRKGEISDQATTPAPLAQALKANFPEIKNATRILGINQTIFRHKDKIFTEQDGGYADNEFLQLFTFPLVKGNVNNALLSPNSLILSKELAIKYFGKTDPIGQTIIMDNNDILTVTGILVDIPENSHLQFDFLISFESLPEAVKNDWHNSSYYTYILLNGNSVVSTLEPKIERYLEKPIQDTTSILYLQPLNKIHLYSSNLKMNLSTSGNIMYVFVFSLLAFFILILACINFINISTASSVTRSTEIALKKFLGAQKRNLIAQFLSESILLCLLSFIIALIISIYLLPSLNSVSGKSFSVESLLDPLFLVFNISIVLITGILSGVYPAIYLSSFHTIDLFKKVFRSRRNSLVIRKVLVIFQLFITVIILIEVIVVSKQTKFLINKDLGYKKKSLIFIPINSEMTNNYESFKMELLNNHAISNVSGSVSLPTYSYDVTTEGVSWPGKDPTVDVLMRGVGVDYDFIETFGIQIADGRSFSRKFPSDSLNFIVNETAVRLMGLENPVGKSFTLWDKTGTIIGVVKDYNIRSLHSEISPLFMRLYATKWLKYIFVSLAPGNNLKTIDFIEKKWKEFAPNTPFQIFYVDDLLNQQYLIEYKLISILKYFTILALVISCLGIFGLAATISKQKTKEIGIRKVNGASMISILRFATIGFLKWTLIANALAMPVAYFLKEKLLQIYPFRADISFWLFVVVGIITLTITILSMSFHAIKSTLINPINFLKYE